MDFSKLEMVLSALLSEIRQKVPKFRIYKLPKLQRLKISTFSIRLNDRFN